ncbi:unnamed protein product [Protopolystoma xenopodis]|uniref:Uncharacterized protein n=1 Tax=Protopolystoma xenopodis TaxID=117903 RepID=A0A448WDY5_9PLAT|nr:unnamed protein product [Protopolystoma xenopodis]
MLNSQLIFGHYRDDLESGLSEFFTFADSCFSPTPLPVPSESTLDSALSSSRFNRIPSARNGRRLGPRSSSCHRDPVISCAPAICVDDDSFSFLENAPSPNGARLLRPEESKESAHTIQPSDNSWKMSDCDSSSSYSDSTNSFGIKPSLDCSHRYEPFKDNLDRFIRGLVLPGLLFDWDKVPSPKQLTHLLKDPAVMTKKFAKHNFAKRLIKSQLIFPSSSLLLLKPIQQPQIVHTQLPALVPPVQGDRCFFEFYKLPNLMLYVKFP